MASHLKYPDLISAPHGFLSRQDGVSVGIYEGLNCGTGSNDDPDNVRENRRIAASLIAGRRDTPLVSCYQIHSDQVVVVSSDWGEDRPKADAMVTNQPGIILGILTADCTPVLFEDANAGVVAAAHAGWKGALGGILEETLTAMEGLGAHRDDISAAIGPTIHAPSYEVTIDFRDHFVGEDSDAEKFFLSGKDNKHFQFDLPGYVHQIINWSDVESIEHADIDTYASDNHFSYRRTTHRGEPDYGRQLSGIMLAR